jgi:hypothetical protein
MVGSECDSFVFTVQHPWIFTEKSLHIMFKNAGFQKRQIKQYARYGLGNVFAWLKEKQPKGNVMYSGISDTIEKAWRANLAENGLGDYLVVYAEK